MKFDVLRSFFINPIDKNDIHADFKNQLICIINDTEHINIFLHAWNNRRNMKMHHGNAFNHRFYALN